MLSSLGPIEPIQLGLSFSEILFLFEQILFEGLMYLIIQRS